MVKKFQSLFGDKTAWRLLFRVAFVTLLLFWVKSSDFSFWPILLFFLTAVIGYFSLPAERKSVRTSFWLVLLGGLFSLAAVPLSFFQILIFVLFIILFFAVLGLGSLFFQDRFVVYGVLNTGLMLLIFMPVFYLMRPESAFYWLIILFGAMILLWRECLGFFEVLSRRRLLISLVLGFLSAELGALLMFLPLGFINAAAFLTLFLLLVRDGMVFYSRGFLDLPFVFRQMVFFIFLSILIFATSRWSVY